MHLNHRHYQCLKKILLTFIVFTANSIFAYDYDLAIVAISKNDENYIKEWIEFHKLVGVQHFYIFCHGDIESYKNILEENIHAGIVDLQSTDIRSSISDQNNVIDFNQIQCQAYTSLIQKVRGIVKWLAVIDTDEFLFSPLVDNINEYLSIYDDYPQIAAIGVNWQMFGTSDVESIPSNQTLIETLTRCLNEKNEQNLMVKTIIRPEYVIKYINPHFPLCLSNYHQTNTNFEPFYGPYSSSVLINHLRINHYWTRDKKYFFKYKIPRQIRWFYTNELPSDAKLSIIDLANQYNECSSDAILRFVPDLRKSLKLTEVH